MKTILLCLALSVAPLGLVACKTAPAARVSEVRTLEAVGLAAKATLDAAAGMLAKGQITVDQWRSVSSFYMSKWQPAYTAAVVAVRSDLSSPASPDLLALALQFAALLPVKTP